MEAVRNTVSLRTWLILLSAIVLTAVGQIFMKLSAVQLTSWSELLHNLHQWQLTNAEIAGLLDFSIGISCYFASMLLWMYVLSFLKLSRAYPLLSLAYVLVYLGAVFWPGLGEDFSMEKNVGILIIMVGVVIVSLPSKPKVMSEA
jgi:undecaprenyl phosphate-alpha-L-ara4N flippase subunit ArnF